MIKKSWTARTVPTPFEGLRSIDNAALGNVFLTDEAGDEFATEAREALSALLEDRSVAWPDSAGAVGRGLWGEKCESPSLVWHAQALGVLFELGYMPTADSVRDHMRIIVKRLDPQCAADPRVNAGRRQPWLLRTRHVAWALAMLAELQVHLGGHALSSELQEVLNEHLAVARLAYSYLDGTPDGPGQWIGLQEQELYWTEYWNGEREPNLLNTIYCALAISRAERHGISLARRRFTRLRPLPDQVIAALASQVSVVARGLETRSQDHAEPKLRARLTPGGESRRAATAQHGSTRGNASQDWPKWREPWACRDELPCSIVALLCLFLVEHAYLVAEEEGTAAGWASLALAQRLGHELLHRSNEWATSIDAFCWEDDPSHDGFWFAPSFSLGLRAILESRVATTTHEAVQRAFETIRLLERSREGDGKKEWIDPTRGLPSISGVTQRHVCLDIRHLIDNPDSAPTAFSTHAAVMAYAALRRSSSREHPRSLLETPPKRPTGGQAKGFLGEACFDAAALQGSVSNATLVLTIGDYVEHQPIWEGGAVLLHVLASVGPARAATVAQTIRESELLKSREAPQTERSVENAVRRINAALGVKFVVEDSVLGVAGAFSSELVFPRPPGM